MIARAGRLPAQHAMDGEVIVPGRIYVAPADHHLLLDHDGVIRVRKGPRENGHRPAIDPLFRSAVAHGYAHRTIAVVLSGYLDDGSAGLYAVRSRGGIAVVQDPDDASGAEMPANAVQYAGADYILPASKIAAKLVALTGLPSEETVMPGKKKQPKKAPAGGNGGATVERNDAPNALVAYPEESVIGTPSVFACPECSGVLWEIKEGGSVRYRCRVGHAYSEASLNGELSQAAESALWAAMRALDEKASMSRRMADAASGPQHWAQRLREQADTYASHAEMLRKMILGEPPEISEAQQEEEKPA